MSKRIAVLAVALTVLLAGCAGLPSGDAGNDVETPDTPTETPTDDESDETTGGDDGPSEDGNETTDGDDGTSDSEEAPAGSLDVHYINVGQADATLVVGPTGETMLIDTGDWRDDGSTVIDYLEAHDVDRIDYLVSTHGHADHIGGHAAVIEHFETEKDGVGAAYDNGVPHTSQTYENYLDAVEEHDVTLYEVREGDDVPFEGVDVTVLNPAVDTDADDLHYDSVSLHLEFGSTSFLFTGDAETDAEARMTDEYGDSLDATVYQAGHHGSNTSSTAPFLDAVDPDATVISAAYDSQYGHPHDEPLDRFADRGVDAYWTATHGTVRATSDGETVTMATQHDAPTDPGTLYESEEATADPTEPTEPHTSYDPDTTDSVAATPLAATGAQTAAVPAAEVGA